MSGRGRHRLWLALATAAVIAGCGSAQHRSERAAAPPRPRPQPIVGTPAFHQESSEAIAGHPTKVPAAPGGCAHRPRERQIRAPRWLDGVEITEYFPTPESWFSGIRVHAPGLPGRHPVDWLYSSAGIAMEGQGIGADGRFYGIGKSTGGEWVSAEGQATVPSACASHWSAGAPLWFGGGWRNARGEVTFPLERGGWSNGRAARTLPAAPISFVQRPSPSIRPYHTVAVDPQLIPIGSRIYIPAYRTINGGWFVAGDTGGGIIGAHIDVYRTPTAWMNDGGRFLTGQRVYVAPPPRQ